MLTPTFELSQDAKFVYVYIRTPYIKIRDVEYFIEEHQFKFYVKPYFLRLNFPGKIIENGNESASYDVDKGIFTVCLPKFECGEHFPDLDLVTKLLAPSGKCNISSPGIEVISQETGCDNDDEDDIDWEWNQQVYDEKEVQNLSISGTKYGFGSQKSGVFCRLKNELRDLVDNPNPDELSHSERRIARIAVEDQKFDEEHYLADFIEDQRIKEILMYFIDINVSFTESEKTKLQQLPNREYIFDHREEIEICYSLVDIMFAFAYNKRTTCGENTVESAWTISKLSATLSWFERFSHLEEVLNTCARRSLAYPLYRHWELCCKVLEDVKHIFKLGRRMILKCLLEILVLFNESEPHYLLNELYITDYCIWIQKVKESKIKSLTKKLLESKIRKKSIGWDLKELETAAMLVCNEEKQRNSVSESNSSESDSKGNDSDCYSTEDETEIVDEFSGAQNTSVREMEDKETGSSNEKVALHVEENKTDQCEEGVCEVEVLPSLLFPAQCFHGKRLVEVIDNKDNKDTDNKEENTECQGDNEQGRNIEFDTNVREGKQKNVLTKETEDERTVTKKTEDEHTLSSDIAKLSINIDS